VLVAIIFYSEREPERNALSARSVDEYVAETKSVDLLSVLIIM